MSATTTHTLVIRLVEQLYGVPVDSVREIIRVPQVTGVPRRPACFRGLINLRGRVIPLVDLRVLLGLEPLRAHLDTLSTTLDLRENDHRRWLSELEAAVVHEQEFRLTTNPHECAFGRWYDRFMQDEMPLALRMSLAKFDSPHQALHALGTAAVAAVRQGERARALQLIECSRDTTLASLIGHFAEVRTLLQDWSDEVAIVVDSPRGPIATAADAVEGIERIEFKSVEEAMHDGQWSALVDGVGTAPQGHRLITLLRMEGIFCEGTAPPA